MKRYFEIDLAKDQEVEEVLGDITIGKNSLYTLNDKKYYIVGALNADEEEYITDSIMNGIAKTISLLGGVEISEEKYKLIEKEAKLFEKNARAESMSEKERVVYQKINEFVEENHIEDVAERAFLNSLRKALVSGKITDRYSFDEYLQNRKGSTELDADLQEKVVELVEIIAKEINTVQPIQEEAKFINTKKYKQSNLF